MSDVRTLLVDPDALNESDVVHVGCCLFYDGDSETAVALCGVVATGRVDIEVPTTCVVCDELDLLPDYCPVAGRCVS